MAQRVAVVTGGGRGIGRDYAKALAEDGMVVVCADILSDGARETVDMIRAAGGSAEAATVDVTEPASASELAALLKKRFGRCDVLVNNAAMFMGNKRSTGMTVEIEYWRRMFRVNLDGPLIMTQALAPLMIENGWGRIVNQASTAAYMYSGDPYGVSKGAVITLTLGLSVELAPKGVTVNAIAPGPIPTEALLSVVDEARLDGLKQATPVSRLGTTADLIHGLRYLVSENAGWITGQTLVIDGGWAKRY